MRMQPVKTYDVIIIGAGPAGIFTALELADKGYSILMVEKGQDIRARIQRAKTLMQRLRIRYATLCAAGAVLVHSVMVN